MPTVSEPVWKDREDKIKAIIADYKSGVDSEAVFKARLHGQGIRGDELTTLFNAITDERINDSIAARTEFEPKAVLVLEHDGTKNIIRFYTADTAAKAVELLRKQPNVRFACRVFHH